MASMPTPGTQTISKQDTKASRGWKVLLYNDDITPFDVVIYALQRAAGLSQEVAEMVCLEAHNEGEAVVRSGLPETEAQVICGGLRRWTRIPDVCPGVDCEALPDDDC